MGHRRVLVIAAAVLTAGAGCSSTESLESTPTTSEAVATTSPSPAATASTVAEEETTTTEAQAVTTTTEPAADTSLLSTNYPDAFWAYMSNERCGDQAWLLDGPPSPVDPELRLSPTLIMVAWSNGGWVETLRHPLDVDGGGIPDETEVRGNWSLLDGLDGTAATVTVGTTSRPYSQLLILGEDCTWHITPVLTTCGVQVTPVGGGWDLSSVTANLSATIDQLGITYFGHTECEGAGSQSVVWNDTLGMAEVRPDGRWCTDYATSEGDGEPLDSPNFAAYFQPIVPCTSGSDVAGAQAALDAAGFPTESDGMFGPGTIRSIAAYQLANGLGLTGILDRDTWEALIGFSVVPAGECGDEVDPADCDY